MGTIYMGGGGGGRVFLDELTAHANNKQNPHSVTAEQVNAYTTTQTDEKLKTKADATTVTQLQTDTTLSYVDVTLKSAGWTGEEAPYSQAVSNEAINGQDVWLMRALDTFADAATVKAYNKAFACITNGTAETGSSSVTFKVLKKPTTDVKVRLMKRGQMPKAQ